MQTSLARPLRPAVDRPLVRAAPVSFFSAIVDERRPWLWLSSSRFRLGQRLRTKRSTRLRLPLDFDQLHVGAICGAPGPDDVCEPLGRIVLSRKRLWLGTSMWFHHVDVPWRKCDVLVSRQTSDTFDLLLYLRPVLTSSRNRR